MWIRKQEPFPEPQEDQSRWQAGPFQFGGTEAKAFEDDTPQERPLQVLGAARSESNQDFNRTRKVRGQLAGTSIIIKNPG